jgi:trans-aconitate methyltransferase
MTTDSSAQLPRGAAQGFKDADAYDAHRPSYPPEVVDDFLRHLLVRDQIDSRIVEIAAGTGKFTELLACRPERFLIKAIEPHKDMREKLAAKDLPAVEVLAGEAKKMPIKSEWGDACIIAQVSSSKSNWHYTGF